MISPVRRFCKEIQFYSEDRIPGFYVSHVILYNQHGYHLVGLMT